MIVNEKPFNGRTLLSQVEREPMAGITMGLVRPGEYNGTQGLECGLKIRRRPGPTGTAFEYGIADNDTVIVIDAETNLIGGMTGGMNDVQKNAGRRQDDHRLREIDPVGYRRLLRPPADAP